LININKDENSLLHSAVQTTVFNLPSDPNTLSKLISCAVFYNIYFTR